MQSGNYVGQLKKTAHVNLIRDSKKHDTLRCYFTCFDADFKDSYAPESPQLLVVGHDFSERCKKYLFVSRGQLGALRLEAQEKSFEVALANQRHLSQYHQDENHDERENQAESRDEVSHPQILGAHLTTYGGPL